MRKKTEQSADYSHDLGSSLGVFLDILDSVPGETEIIAILSDTGAPLWSTGAKK